MKPVTNEAYAITPHDTNYLAKPGVIYVGVAGDVNVLPFVDANTNTPGNGVVFKNCYAGFIIPVTVRKVFSTSTTATNLVCLPDV